MTLKQALRLQPGALLKLKQKLTFDPYYAHYAQILGTYWDGERDCVRIAWYQSEDMSDETEFDVTKWIADVIPVVRQRLPKLREFFPKEIRQDFSMEEHLAAFKKQRERTLAGLDKWREQSAKGFQDSGCRQISGPHL